jgi:hypothetical protein
MILMDNFWLFVLSLLGMSTGSAFQTDLLAVVSTDNYLQAQQVDLTPGKLLEVVKQTPKTPRESAIQLLAIRWFGENPDQVADHKQTAVDVLQALAKGPPGFARDYALTALARLDGKVPPPLHFMPKDSTRVQAFEWFPDDVALLAAIDLRAAAGQKDPDPEFVAAISNMRKQFLAALPPMAIPGLHGIVNGLGNVRIDRVAFAYCPDPTMQRQECIFVRLTGQGDAKRIAEFIKNNLQQGALEERKGPNGVTIRILSQPQMPVFAFVGDTDLLICGDEASKNSGEVFDQVLAVMSGKRGSAAKGPFAQSLQAVPAEARGVLVGALPDEVKRELSRSPLGVAPQSVLIDMAEASAGKGTVIRVRASFESEADAKKAVDGAKLLLKQGIDGLKMLPFKVKPEAIAILQKALEAVEVKVDGAVVSGTARLTPATLRALGDLFEGASKGLK